MQIRENIYTKNKINLMYASHMHKCSSLWLIMLEEFMECFVLMIYCNWTDSVQVSSEDIGLSSLPCSIIISNKFPCLMRDVITFLVFCCNLFNICVITIFLSIVSLKTIVDTCKLFIVSDVLHFQNGIYPCLALSWI